MNDNEKVQALRESLLRDVNAAALPLGVKAVVLENLLLRVEMAMNAETGAADTSEQAAPGKEAPDA